MSEATKLIPSIQALLTLPVVSADVELFTACYQLLMLLTSTHHGLLHLATNFESVVLLSQHLLKSSPRLDVERPGTAGYLGTVLAFSLQTVSSVDQISRCLEAASYTGANTEDIEEEMVLHFR